MRLYRLANLLNLDVAFGALGSLTLATSLCRAPMLPAWNFLLPLAVWATYTLDHLLDSVRLSVVSAAPRHQMAKRHAQTLTISVCLALIILCFGGVCLLPRRLLWLSGALGVSTIAHVYAAYAEWYYPLVPFSKESTVAIVYGAGTWGGPLLLTSTPLSWSTCFLLLLFLLIVLLNLGLFHWFERLQTTPSLLTEQGRCAVPLFLDVIFYMVFTVTIIAYVLIPARQSHELFLLMLMGAILWMMRLTPSLFLPDERFRLVGDGVFLLPLVLFFRGALQ